MLTPLQKRGKCSLKVEGDPESEPGEASYKSSRSSKKARGGPRKIHPAYSIRGRDSEQLSLKPPWCVLHIHHLLSANGSLTSCRGPRTSRRETPFRAPPLHTRDRSTMAGPPATFSSSERLREGCTCGGLGAVKHRGFGVRDASRHPANPPEGALRARTEPFSQSIRPIFLEALPNIHKLSLKVNLFLLRS